MSPCGELLPVSLGEEIYHLAPLDKVTWTSKDGTQQGGKLDGQGVLDVSQDLHLNLLGVTIKVAEQQLHKAFPEIREIHWTEFRENSASVLGEAYNQTKVDLGEAPLRVLDVVAAAGGFTPLADQTSVTLVRRNAGRIEVFQLNLAAATHGQAPQFNILVQPGDVITIPRSIL